MRASVSMNASIQLKRVMLAALALALLSARPAVANDRVGAWQRPTIPWHVIPIHMVLTPEGKVMSFGTTPAGTKEPELTQGANLYYEVWDPALGISLSAHQLLPNRSRTDIFCAAQVLLPRSGSVLLTGGDNGQEGNWGNPNTTLFDGKASVLTDAGFTMAYPRWYATMTTLPNGEILVQGGSDNGGGGTGMLTPEIFDPAKGWRSLFGATSALAYGDGDGSNRWWYPRSFVVPDGRVFGISGPAMYFLNPSGDGSITYAGTFSGPNRGATSTAVMFAPGKILQVGGGAFTLEQGNAAKRSNATTAASVIDVTRGKPEVTNTAPMHYPRHWATATLLADGRVLVTGGSKANNVLEDNNKPLNERGAALNGEIWDPATRTWSVVTPPEDQARMYHSAAILLPDATVLSGGGGEPGPFKNANAQIYYPPYLFKGTSLAPRPIIKVHDPRISYGGVVTLVAESSSAIRRVTLVKTGAVTHSFNSEQRFLDLPFSVRGNSITATIPSSSAVATPGYYLVFAWNADGVPSVGKILHLPPPGPPAANLVRDGGFESVIAPNGGFVEVMAGSDIGPWTVWSGGVSVHSNTASGLGTKGATGAHHLDLNGPPKGEVRQVINGLTPGATYSLTFDYAIHSAAGGSASAQVSIGDFQWKWSATNAGDSHWTQAAHSFTATRTAHTLSFSGTGGAECCGMLIDDVTIVQTVPAPPSPVVQQYPWNDGSGGLSLDGVRQYAQVPHTPQQTLKRAMTLSARVFVDAFGDWDGVITKGVSVSPYAMQLWGNGALRFTANWGAPAGGAGAGSWNSTRLLTTGRWHHVAVTYDGRNIRFYIDGVLDSYQPAANLTFGSTTEPLIIGADFPGGDEYFDGKIADVRVFSEALSTEQIRALASSQTRSPVTPVVEALSTRNGFGISFNGTSQYWPVVHTNGQTMSRAVTMAAHIFVDEFGDWDGIITKGVNVSPYAMQLWRNGALRFTANEGGPAGGVGKGSWNSSTLLTAGRWHHVAVTYDGLNIRFYIDGALDSYQPAANLSFGATTEPLIVGVDFPGGDEYFDGRIANVKVFNQALAAEQIRVLATERP